MKAIDKIMQLVGASTDVELAEKLSVPAGTVGSWRSRGVPKRVLREWSLRFGKSVDWFNGEDETEKADYPIAVQGIIGKVMKLGELEQIEAFRILAEKFPDEQTTGKR